MMEGLVGGVCSVKIKPASILASIQNREAQWTQAPDRDTDTLPRITGHSTVLSAPKASVVSRILGWFHCYRHPSALIPAFFYAETGRLLWNTMGILLEATDRDAVKVHETHGKHAEVGSSKWNNSN